MGQFFNFKCSTCSYKVCFSGGPDCGFKRVTNSFTCTSCKIVQDIGIPRDWEIGKNDSSDKKDAANTYTGPTCRECDRQDTLVVWDPVTRPCPECGGQLNTSGVTAFFWD